MMTFFSMLDKMFKKKLVLRPNCLLTRKPIVFISGNASPFLYKKPWQEAVYFLYEHGYKVEVLQLPFHKTSSKTLFFKNWVQKQLDQKAHQNQTEHPQGIPINPHKQTDTTSLSSPFFKIRKEEPYHNNLDIHFFMDEPTYHELKTYFTNIHIGSLNVICSSNKLDKPSPSPSTQAYELSQKFLITPSINLKTLSKTINGDEDSSLNHFIIPVPAITPNWRYKLHSRYLRSKGASSSPIEESFYKAPLSSLNLLLDHCIHLAELDFDN